MLSSAGTQPSGGDDSRFWDWSPGVVPGSTWAFYLGETRGRRPIWDTAINYILHKVERCPWTGKTSLASAHPEQPLPHRARAMDEEGHINSRCQAPHESCQAHQQETFLIFILLYYVFRCYSSHFGSALFPLRTCTHKTLFYLYFICGETC